MRKLRLYLYSPASIKVMSLVTFQRLGVRGAMAVDITQESCLSRMENDD